MWQPALPKTDHSHCCCWAGTAAYLWCWRDRVHWGTSAQQGRNAQCNSEACGVSKEVHLALTCLQVTGRRQKGRQAWAGGQHWALQVPEDQVTTHPCPGPSQVRLKAKAARQSPLPSTCTSMSLASL